MPRPKLATRFVTFGAAGLLVAGLFVQPATILAAGPSGSIHASALTSGRQRSARPAKLGSTRIGPLLTRSPGALPFDPGQASATLAGLETANVATLKGREGHAGVSPAVVGPPAPVLATNSGRPSAATPVSVAGQTEAGAGNAEPADAGIAVGPDNVIETDSLSFLFTDRLGNPFGALSMPDFFGLPEPPDTTFTTFDSDPRIHYDQHQRRWIATEVSWDCATDTFPGDTAAFGHGFIDYAISDTSDPLGGWTFALFAWDDFLPTQASFGESSDKLAITANLFAMGPGGSLSTPGCGSGAFAEAHVIIMDWASLGPNFDGSTVPTFDGGDPTESTTKVAFGDTDPSPDLRFVGMANGAALGETAGDVIVLGASGSAAHGSISFSAFNATIDGIVSDFLVPPNPQQPGGNLTTVIDGGPQGSWYRAGGLWTSATYPCTPTGDSTLRDCMRVISLGDLDITVDPTNTGDVLLGTNGFDDSFGGMGLSVNSNLLAVYSQSSATVDPSSWETHHVLPDAFGEWSDPALLDAGAMPYSGSLWGAYLDLAPDPQDPDAYWAGNTWADSSGGWSTTIHQLNTGAGDGYVPVAPMRVLDTRIGRGLSGVFTANVPRTFQVAGVTVNSVTIPGNAVAITGNLTVTQQTGAGNVALTPTPTANPTSSTLNFPLADDRANNVTIALSATGSASAVYKATTGRHTQLILDVTGYFLAGSGQAYHPISSTRVLDTRTSHTTHLFHANVAQAFQVTNGTTIPSTATAITANVTVTNQTKAGYVALTPTNTNNPTTSTINFPLKDDRANGLTVPLSVTGTVSAVYKAAAGGTTNLILDVTGYYSSAGGGLLFHPLNPGRRIDTRLALGTAGQGNGLSGPQGTTSRSAVIAGHFGVPATAAAITGNLTITGQTGAGYVAVTDSSIAHPTTSTINFPLADDRANGITTPLGAGDLWFVYQVLAGKHVQLIVDLTGYFQ